MNTMKRTITVILLTLLCGSILGLSACFDNDDDNDLDEVGQPCESADDCYLGIDQEDLSGDVVCIDEVSGGYCSHYCTTHADCCAVEGECDDELDLDYVCGPFQSTGEMYCFISCEGEENGDDYCQLWAHPDFICRSTGGGNENEKVCVPPG
jgi:hypothetical protein